jgi:tripartite-type tricarboxylate transporter receptor subunit TctC
MGAAVPDFVAGYEASAWNGITAPRNTPVEIIERLNIEINTALNDPKIKMRFAEFGATIAITRGSPIWTTTA